MFEIRLNGYQYKAAWKHSFYTPVVPCHPLMKDKSCSKNKPDGRPVENRDMLEASPIGRSLLQMKCMAYLAVGHSPSDGPTSSCLLSRPVEHQTHASPSSS